MLKSHGTPHGNHCYCCGKHRSPAVHPMGCILLAITVIPTGRSMVILLPMGLSMGFSMGLPVGCIALPMTFHATSHGTSHGSSRHKLYISLDSRWELAPPMGPIGLPMGCVVHPMRFHGTSHETSHGAYHDFPPNKYPMGSMKYLMKSPMKGTWEDPYDPFYGKFHGWISCNMSMGVYMGSPTGYL